jgi:hypothetical protein
MLLTASERLVLSLSPNEIDLPGFDDVGTREADLFIFLFFNGTVGSWLSCGCAVTSPDTASVVLAAVAI